jgi:hypothetical protein
MDEPGWIELLFKRLHGSDPFSTPFIMKLNQERFQDAMGCVPDGAQLLHRAALHRLTSEDDGDVVCALAALLAVGDKSDAAAVEPLLEHPEDFVRKSARACLFELKRR